MTDERNPPTRRGRPPERATHHALGPVGVLAEPRPEQRHDGPFLVGHGGPGRTVVLGRPNERGPDPSVEIGVDHRRVDVRLAGDSGRVAEFVGRGRIASAIRCFSRSVEPCPIARSARYARTVPAQVRKSFAVMPGATAAR